MKCLSVLLVAVALAFLGKTVLAQETAGIPDDILNELDYFAGTWETEGKVGETQQTGRFTCRWARTDDKKVCLIGRFSYKTGDEVRSGVTLIGWNAAMRCIEDRGFDANGGCGRLLWTVKSPTEWHGEVIMVEKGKEVSSKATLVKTGSSEIVMESKTEDGVASRWVFRRVKQEQEKRATD